MKHISVEYKRNDIDPNTQVSFPYYFDGANINDAFFRVMFIGNSITFHEKKEEIGWNKNCGMAASDINHDYVHIVLNYLLKINPLTNICVFNAANWESHYFKNESYQILKGQIQNYHPNLIIIRLGENMSKPVKETNIDPQKYFLTLIDDAKKITDKVIVTSLFWHHDIISKALYKASIDSKVTFVNIEDLSENDINKAIGQYSHQGICGHPSDEGMKNIAERIILEIKNL